VTLEVQIAEFRLQMGKNGVRNGHGTVARARSQSETNRRSQF